MSDWKPIKSAPKTVKGGYAVEILGWCPDETARLGGDIRVIWWEPMLKGGIWYSDRDLAERPTRWMQLPEPPK